MSWRNYTSLTLGGVLNEIDERLSRLNGARRDRDSEQDDRLRELEGEVMQLNAALAAVVGIVRDKGIATDQEIAAALDNAVKKGEQGAAAKETAKQERAAASVKEAALRKLERIRRKRSD